MNKVVKSTLFTLVGALLVFSLIITGCSSQIVTSTPTAKPPAAATTAPTTTSAATPTAKSTAPTAPASAAKAIKIRFSVGTAPSHHASLEQKWFGSEVNKRTNGQVNVEVYLGGQLYSHEQVADAVVSGAVEMGMASGGHWSARNPLFGFYNYMFMLRDSEHFRQTKETLKKLLFPIWEKQNVKAINWIGFGDNGFIGNFPVALPGDLKGRMVRGGNQQTNLMLQAVGAVPASIATAEVYDALGKKAIEGVISSWDTSYSRKWNEVSKYITGTFNGAVWLAFMNLDTWNSLPKEAQDIIMQVGKESEEMSFVEGKKADIAAIEAMKSGKLSVTTLSADQTAKWLEVSRPTWGVWVKECEKAGFKTQAEEIIKILEAAK